MLQKVSVYNNIQLFIILLSTVFVGSSAGAYEFSQDKTHTSNPAKIHAVHNHKFKHHSGYLLKHVPFKILKKKSRTAVTLQVFDCGEIQVNDLSLFNPALIGQSKLLKNACYYIEHPKKGGLIWDTGFNDSLADAVEPQVVFGGAIEATMPSKLSTQLQHANIDPSKISYMAISHLHFDHTGNMPLFSQAQWLIQKPEWALAFSEQAAAASFNPDNYSHINKSRTKLLKGHYDVFDDGSVIILSAPGHTVGHQMLYVKLKNTGPVLLSGDLYHFMENRENYGIPVFNDSKKDTVSSFAFIDKLVDKTGAKLWIQHDADQFADIKLSPFIYD